MNLGIAFQLIDDALDYGGKSAKLGKNVGDDFREGKITLPVVLSFRRGSESEREFWNRTLGEGDVRDGDLDTAIALMAKHHAIEDTVGRARHYGAIATDALALVPASEIKTALEEAVAFCIARAHCAERRPARRRRTDLQVTGVVAGGRIAPQLEADIGIRVLADKSAVFIDRRRAAVRLRLAIQVPQEAPGERPRGVAAMHRGNLRVALAVMRLARLGRLGGGDLRAASAIASHLSFIKFLRRLRPIGKSPVWPTVAHNGGKIMGGKIMGGKIMSGKIMSARRRCARNEPTSPDGRP